MFKYAIVLATLFGSFSTYGMQNIRQMLGLETANSAVTQNSTPLEVRRPDRFNAQDVLQRREQSVANWDAVVSALNAKGTAKDSTVYAWAVANQKRAGTRLSNWKSGIRNPRRSYAKTSSRQRAPARRGYEAKQTEKRRPSTKAKVAKTETKAASKPVSVREKAKDAKARAERFFATGRRTATVAK